MKWKKVTFEDIIDCTEDDAKNAFIENLAKISAIEVITNGKLSY
jgi:hypothetical protein